MKIKIIVAFVLALSAASCATTSGYQLTPPENSTHDKRYADIQECWYEATQGKELSNQDRELLKEKQTGRFLRNNRPVVTSAGVPAEFMSVFRSNASTKLSDQYVLCLITKGFRWESRK
jgi:phenylpropionate dioxygenase-like ring-hydroxylating dioxygenase large terminal subunit